MGIHRHESIKMERGLFLHEFVEKAVSKRIGLFLFGSSDKEEISRKEIGKWERHWYWRKNRRWERNWQECLDAGRTAADSFPATVKIGRAHV